MRFILKRAPVPIPNSTRPDP
jgi:hypothetical protein